MEKPLVEVCVEVITARLQCQEMRLREVVESIRVIHGTLHALQASDHQNGTPPVEGLEALTVLRRNPLQSLQKMSVTCLECGRPFMLLSNRHLALHGLTPRLYKKKWRIPLTASLSSQTLTARRRKLAKERDADKGLVAWRAARDKRVGYTPVPSSYKHIEIYNQHVVRPEGGRDEL